MSFVHSEFPEIKTLFLAQFHTDLGPIVQLSVPEDAFEGEQKTYSESSRDRADDKNTEENEQTATTAASDTYSRPQLEHDEVIHLIRRPNQSKPASIGDKIDFNSIQTLVIPKLTLFERLITVHTGKHKIMCYPIAVEGNYQRNVLIFNMCFAFDIEADTKCYGTVVKRVGCLLKELEIGGRLLSNPAGQRPLLRMMQQMVSKLNAHGEYQIELDMKGLSPSSMATGVSIKLFPHYENPANIELYHVPIKTIDFELAKLKSAQTMYQTQVSEDVLWDLVLDRVINFINNVNHVARIARLAQIREETVVLALKHLEYYGCITLVDIFQFSNIYETQHRLMELYNSAWLQRECYSYVTRNGNAGGMEMEELIRLYATVRNRCSVAEWIVENNIDVERLDVRRFVMFGVMHKLLQRVYCYPVFHGLELETESGGPANSETRDLDSDSTTHIQALKEGEKGAGGLNGIDTSNNNDTHRANSSDGDGLEPQLVKMLDGTHHLDEISIAMNKDTATLYEILENHGSIDYIYL